MSPRKKATTKGPLQMGGAGARFYLSDRELRLLERLPSAALGQLLRLPLQAAKVRGADRSMETIVTIVGAELLAREFLEPEL